MKCFRYFLPILVLALLVACGSEFKPDTMSKKDIGIVKIDDSNASVNHGMTRAEAEKIIGEGKGSPLVAYNNGVSILYRKEGNNEAVAFIALDKDADKVYQTARGIKVGALKSDVLKSYGEKYPMPTHKVDRDISYVFDLTGKKFLDQTTIFEKVKDEKELYEHIGVDFLFNDDGFVERIALYDRHAAMYFN